MNKCGLEEKDVEDGGGGWYRTLHPSRTREKKKQ